MTENGREPAFPVHYRWEKTGLTKREEFARSMAQGLLSRGIVDGSKIGVCTEGFMDPRTVACFAVKYADALLDKLEKGQTDE